MAAHHLAIEPESSSAMRFSIACTTGGGKGGVQGRLIQAAGEGSWASVQCAAMASDSINPINATAAPRAGITVFQPTLSAPLKAVTRSGPWYPMKVGTAATAQQQRSRRGASCERAVQDDETRAGAPDALANMC